MTVKLFSNSVFFSLLDKEEGKTISLGTSKLNYLDPRISVAWTKKWDIPVEKVYNKTQKEKFQVRLLGSLDLALVPILFSDGLIDDFGLQGI